MDLMVSLPDNLAHELTTRASQEQQSAEAFASHLLGDALHRLCQSDAWRERNQRRLSLIQKSITETLDAAEQLELEQLQTEMDQHFEASDNQLLDTLKRMKQEVQHLPDVGS